MQFKLNSNGKEASQIFVLAQRMQLGPVGRALKRQFSVWKAQIRSSSLRFQPAVFWTPTLKLVGGCSRKSSQEMITTTLMWRKIHSWMSVCSLPTLKRKKGNCSVTQQPGIALNKVPWKFQTIPCRDGKGDVGENGPCGLSPKSGREQCLSTGTVRGQGE